ncbi:MAG TPA: MmgE/PrpD family protein, partial [Pseudolysinimonas sp.]
DLLAAFAVGVEVTLRLCAAMDGSLYRGPRWHAPGVIGPFGSAAVYGRLSGLDAPELQRAWGAALLHSAGTFSAIGTPGVKLTQARGAAAGLQAIVFARAGHGGSPDALVHPDGGLFDAYAGADPESVVRDLGTTWLSPELSLRQWPASSSLQSLIAAVLDLRATEGPDEGASLVIDLPPQSYKLCAQMPWDSQLNALQSAAWVAGSAWVDGRCWLDQFESVGLRNQSRNAVAGRIRVVVDPQLPEGAARVRSGEGGNPATRLHAPGSPADPLGAEAIRAKLILAAGEARAAELTARVTGDQAGDSADLMALFRLED